MDTSSYVLLSMLYLDKRDCFQIALGTESLRTMEISTKSLHSPKVWLLRFEVYTSILLVYSLIVDLLT